MRQPHRTSRHERSGGIAVSAVTAVLLVVTTACTAGAGGKSDTGHSINVLMVNNPQMVDLQRLTADNFTAETGITVNYTVLPENDLRDKVSQEFSSQANQYDVATLSNFEIPIYAGNDWLYPLDDFVANDPEFDQPDIFPSMTASLSADGRALRGAVLRRVLVPDVPQGHLRRQGPGDAGAADLAGGRRHGRPGRQRPTGHARHLPARSTRLGSGHRPADHRGEHLRRYLVRRGLDRAGQRARVHRGHRTST